ncbi:hypothetical protein I317_02800 [Kwoniella heveanensis CBS 569]|nr:hypothetical protein I317_02800 [Kwoniella heveanensis CBS 569]
MRPAVKALRASFSAGPSRSRCRVQAKTTFAVRGITQSQSLRRWTSSSTSTSRASSFPDHLYRDNVSLPTTEYEDATPLSLSDAELLKLLSQNSELSSSPKDIQNELRWIRNEVRQRGSELLKKGQLPPVEDELIQSWVERRSRGEPLQYILGSTDFGPLTIKCVRPVLVPRPETAHCTSLLSQSILSFIPPLTSASRPKAPMDVLDLCTGSGCIALLLARLNPLLRVRGVDNSPAAVALGMANAKALDLDDRVTVRYGNLFADPPGGLLPDSGWTRSAPAPLSSAASSRTSSASVPAPGSTTSTSSINARRHEGSSPRSRFLASEYVSEQQADMFKIKSQQGLSSNRRKVGLVVANPPYIPYDEWKDLPASVREYESPSALLGDVDGGGRTLTGTAAAMQGGKGLKYYERIAEILPDLLLDQETLEKDGWGNPSDRGQIPRLALEVGKGQAQDVVDIVRSRSGGMIGRTEIWKDQFGVERFVVGWSK